ncbi:MAG: DUF4280 domain-containing protein [Gammaproteobacteria bacterium]|nr:DUF4280 domain-containing protein [Gammaproteobacteria bacterium]MDH5693399.1 DUF4280 domain-containing protein [Gammaproteobacteria bacterium]
MSSLVITTAQIKCSFGAAPGVLTVPPSALVNSNKQPVASIMDSKPNVNIPPFGMCSSPSNPTVASATTAASGVLTPQPCVPAVAAPWTPGSSTVMAKNYPALNNSSTCTCSWAGVISILSAGQVNTNVP